MPKPQRRPSRPEAPQPSQLAAVRRALEDGHTAQARQRLAAPRESFPGFKPLRALAWEVECQAGVPKLAAARVRLASRRTGQPRRRGSPCTSAPWPRPSTTRMQRSLRTSRSGN